tara:strand:- start:1759 stop:2079 length:321 start_codon:yes stop_codon:yes gene_type:complete
MDSNNNDKSQKGLKIFFIKLISITIVIVVVINLLFNLFFAERLEKLDRILMLDRSDIRHDMKDKIRDELNDALKKENLIYEEDKILLYKLYHKIKKEFQNLDKSKL